MELLEKIPKPVLYGGGALLVLFFFLRMRPPSRPGSIDPILQSMGLAADTNIRALAITAPAQVEMARENTARYAIATQAVAAREAAALDYFREVSAGKTSIKLAHMDSITTRVRDRQDFQLSRQNLSNARRANDQAFKAAREKTRLEFKLEKKGLELDEKFFPDMFRIAMEQLGLDRDWQRQQHEIQSRRLDIMEWQALLSPGGIVQGGIGAVRDISDVGFGIWDRIAGPAVGATTGAAIGSAVLPGPGTLVGAAAGGGGGLS